MKCGCDECVLGECSCLFASKQTRSKARGRCTSQLSLKEERSKEFPRFLKTAIQIVSRKSPSSWTILSQLTTLHHALARPCRRVCATTSTFRYTEAGSRSPKQVPSPSISCLHQCHQLNSCSAVLFQSANSAPSPATSSSADPTTLPTKSPTSNPTLMSHSSASSQLQS